MVITTNDITQKNYKKLSIQVSLSGLSFCVFDLITKKVITHNNIEFEKNKVIEEQLWKVFIDNPILINSYDEVIVLHDNNLNTFVPDALFDVNQIGSYLQYNVKVFETDLFNYDSIENYNINNVYVPYVNINNFLLDQFSSFDYKNVNTILVKKILDLSIGNNDKQVFVHFQPDSFQIIVVKNQLLFLFNSFEYSTPEDFIYYLLFTYEQLQLSPETISTQLLGNIEKSSDYFKIAYKFIRHCDLLNTEKLINVIGKTDIEIRNNFILFHS
ncbi:hypothetical protein SY27_03050 [Flavobacterium sp. 316]|uniref:DUF3822 family protein n=1 Tax=Flavobacterium sp. 316 TaxID=1603293 RepID=UPI0005DE0A3F|nr:DUF3822 family protein [Flavobacterium sp. 316]KIX22808.1 hypothetical protein SY27_03050 [Flavobacterium sp. 316]